MLQPLMFCTCPSHAGLAQTDGIVQSARARQGRQLACISALAKVKAPLPTRRLLILRRGIWCELCFAKNVAKWRLLTWHWACCAVLNQEDGITAVKAM
jgi:hypothetical protein